MSRWAIKRPNNAWWLGSEMRRIMIVSLTVGLWLATPGANVS